MRSAHDETEIDDPGDAAGSTAVRALSCLVLALLGFAACAHRYSEDPDDWLGPHREGRFESDLADCRERMRKQPFAYGADARLVFLDCMDRRGWTLIGADR